MTLATERRSAGRRLFNCGVACVAAVVALSAGAATARDYTRSCTATYGIGPSDFRGTGVQRSFRGEATVSTFRPNTAREMARRKIDECIDAHWAHRQLGTRPSACTEANQTYGYPFRTLHAEIAQAICLANPGHASIRVNIVVGYEGDVGCLLRQNYWSRTIATDYQVNCAAPSHEAGTNRPGMDYRDFNLATGATWQACQAACNAEAQCRAWTYVRPGIQGPAPHCWLKDGVPPARSSDCCTSGVKQELH